MAGFVSPARAQDCEQNYRNAIGLYEASRRVDAGDLFRRLVRCPEPVGPNAAKWVQKIDSELECQRKRNKVIQAADRAAVCKAVAEFERTCSADPEVTARKKAVGGCIDPKEQELYDQATATLEDAKALADRGKRAQAGDRLRKAQGLASDLRALNPRFPGLEALASEVAELQKASKVEPAKSEPAGGGSAASRPPAPPSEACQEVKGLLAQNRYREVLQAAGLHPKDSECTSAAARARSAMEGERSYLRGVLGQFYGGDYLAARANIEKMLASGQLSPEAGAVSELYLGAAMLSSFYGSGESDAALRDTARVHLQASLRRWPALSEKVTGLSPRIINELKRSASPPEKPQQ
jgi:hypothetical protein